MIENKEIKMNNLVFKEKLVVLFCWGAAFLHIVISSYDFINGLNSIENVILSLGVGIIFFSIGLIPKFFFMPLKLALKSQQLPILVSARTQHIITLIGMCICCFGLSMKIFS